MEVKEVTEFDYINFLESFKELITREFYNPPGIRDVNKRIDEIIALLQQGEIDKEELIKYRLMWERFCVNEGDLVKVINCVKRRYEQKYFPKPVKKPIIKEVIK